VDGDGHVDAQDSNEISMYLMQPGHFLPHLEAADVDCDGQITGDDVNCVWDLSQGLIEAFRCDFDAVTAAACGLGTGGSGGAPCGLNRGDVNGDGEVAKFDGDIVAQYGACNPVPAPFYWVVADANCDGKISIVDGLQIAQAAQGTVQLVSCNAGSGGASGGAAGAPGFAGNAGTAGSAGQRSCAAGVGGTGVAGAGGAAAALLLGDVNGDGVVDVLDADAVAVHSANCEVTGFHPEVADVNCDCAVNLWDARLIAKYVQRALARLGCDAQ
jgi:hypothetical protein